MSIHWHFYCTCVCVCVFCDEWRCGKDEEKRLPQIKETKMRPKEARDGFEFKN